MTINDCCSSRFDLSNEVCFDDCFIRFDDCFIRFDGSTFIHLFDEDLDDDDSMIQSFDKLIDSMIDD